MVFRLTGSSTNKAGKQTFHSKFKVTAVLPVFVLLYEMPGIYMYILYVYHLYFVLRDPLEQLDFFVYIDIPHLASKWRNIKVSLIFLHFEEKIVCVYTHTHTSPEGEVQYQ